MLLYTTHRACMQGTSTRHVAAAAATARFYNCVKGERDTEKMDEVPCLSLTHGKYILLLLLPLSYSNAAMSRSADKSQYKVCIHSATV